MKGRDPEKRFILHWLNVTFDCLSHIKIMMRAVPIFSLLLCILTAATIGVWAEDSLPVLTMDQVVEQALATGWDKRILTATLDMNRSQQALAEAKNSFNLSGKLGYTATAGLLGTYTDKDTMLGVLTPEILYPTMSKDTAAALGDSTIPLPQTITGSLTAAVPGSGGTPFTSIGLNASQKLQTNSYTGKAGIDTITNATTIGVSLSQTVWDGMPGGQPKAAIDRSRLVLQGQELGTKSNQLALVLKIRQAFLTMLVAQKNLDVLANIAARQNSLLTLAQAKFDLQQAIKVDLLSARISARNAELDQQNGQNSFVSAREALSVLMGRDAKQEYRISEPPTRNLPADNLAAALAMARSQRSDLQQLDLNAAASKIDQSLGLAATSPSVVITGGVNLALNWTTAGVKSQTQTGTFYAGLSLGVPILDAGQAAAQVAIATNQVAIYQQQNDQLARTVAMQVETAWHNCQVLAGRAETARQAVEMLALQYQLVQSQESSGTATIKDDLAAAANLASAELALLQAEFNLQLAILNLENSMGQ
jgi:outer membrane protein